MASLIYIYVVTHHLPTVFNLFHTQIDFLETTYRYILKMFISLFLDLIYLTGK